MPDQHIISQKLISPASNAPFRYLYLSLRQRSFGTGRYKPNHVRNQCLRNSEVFDSSIGL
jgi:hypothetical protein